MGAVVSVAAVVSCKHAGVALEGERRRETSSTGRLFRLDVD